MALMNRRGKMIGIFVLLVLLGVLAFFYYAAAGKQDTGGGIVVSVVAVLAVASLVLLYVQRRNEKKNLSGSYLEAYDEVVQRIGTSNLSYIDKREATRQVMEILTEARREQKEVGEAIGDCNGFADNLIGAYGGVRSVLSAIIRGAQFLMGYALFLQMITWMMSRQVEGIGFFETPTLLMTHVAYGIIVMVALPILNLGSAKKHAALYMIAAVLIVVGVTAVFIYGARGGFLEPLYQEMVVFPGAGAIAVWLIGIVLLQLAYKKVGRVKL